MLMLGYSSACWRWYVAIPWAWACYLAAALLLHVSGLAQSPLLGFAVLPALWLAATRALPQPAVMPQAWPLPRIELLARMAAAALLVVTLTSASSWVGPQLTGVLAGAPVAAVVIPAFTLANVGRDALLLTLRGFLTGLMGFTVFFLLLGHGIVALGLWAWPLALAGGVGTGLLATQRSRRGLRITSSAA